MSVNRAIGYLIFLSQSKAIGKQIYLIFRKVIFSLKPTYDDNVLSYY